MSFICSISTIKGYFLESAFLVGFFYPLRDRLFTKFTFFVGVLNSYDATAEKLDEAVSSLDRVIEYIYKQDEACGTLSVTLSRELEKLALILAELEKCESTAENARESLARQNIFLQDSHTRDAQGKQTLEQFIRELGQRLTDVSQQHRHSMAQLQQQEQVLQSKQIAVEQWSQKASELERQLQQHSTGAEGYQQQLRTHLHQKDQSLHKMSSENQQLRSEMQREREQFQQQLSKLGRDLQGVSQQLHSEIVQRESLEETKSSLMVINEQYDQDYKALEEKFSALKDSYTVVHQANQEWDAHQKAEQYRHTELISETEREKASFKAKLAELQVAMNHVESERTKLHEDIGKEKLAVARTRRQANSKDRQIQQLESELATQKAVLKDLEQQRTEFIEKDRVARSAREHAEQQFRKKDEKIQVLESRLSLAEKNAETLGSESEKQKDRITALQEDRSSVEQTAQRLELELEEIKSELSEAAQQSKATLGDKVQFGNEVYALYKKQATETLKKISKVYDQQKEIRKLKTELDTRVDESAVRKDAEQSLKITLLESRMASQGDELDSKRQEVSQLTEKQGEMDSELLQLKHQLSQMVSRADSEKTSSEARQSELDAAQEQNDKLQVELRTLGGEKKRLQVENDSLRKKEEKHIAGLAKSEAELQKEIQQGRTSNAQLRGEIDTLSGELEQRNTRIQDLQISEIHLKRSEKEWKERAGERAGRSHLTNTNPVAYSKS